MRTRPTLVRTARATLAWAGVFALLLTPVVNAHDGGEPTSTQPLAIGRPADPETQAGPIDRTEPARRLDLELSLPDYHDALRQAGRLAVTGLTWYRQTPPTERMTWGGLIACAALGLSVLLERLICLRRRQVIPQEFTARFLDRLHEGKLDGGMALDYCEMNPSPAARVALAAVRRWGRPAADLERAVALAHRVEADRLRRNVGSLRRIAVLAPLLGLLGTLMAAGKALATLPSAAQVAEGAAAVTSAAWGPALAAALTPLTLGVAIATLALVVYDGLVIRIERLAGMLDRLGAETIDAIAMTTPAAGPSLLAVPTGHRAREPHTGHTGMVPGAVRAPHPASGERSRTTGAGRHPSAGDDEIGF